jgi:hypothetical protein
VPSAQDTFKALVAEHVAPRFKTRGFRRQRNNWGKRRADGWVLFSIQVSAFSNKDQLSFTANIAMQSDRFPLWNDVPVDPHRMPSFSHCNYQQRIGYLTPRLRDAWWEIDADDSPFSVRRLSRGKHRSPTVTFADFVNVLDTGVLPFLERALTDTTDFLALTEGSKAGTRRSQIEKLFADAAWNPEWCEGGVHIPTDASPA